MRRRTEVRKPRARAKVAAEKRRRVAQKELEENPTPLEVRQSESKRVTKHRTMGTLELKNVVAETIMRIWPEEFGSSIDLLNAKEGLADRIVWAMKYGGWNDLGYAKIEPGIPMREHDFGKPPRCKEHR